jgi:hypothetical protein
MVKKNIVILVLFINILFAESVSFHEGKYVEALDLFTYRDGNVSYDENKTVICYKDGKSIVKIENNLTVYSKEKEVLTSFDLLKKPDILLYFSLTKALFTKDFNALEESFEVKKKSSKLYDFLPKGDVDKIMKKIELHLKDDESIEFFILKFTNGDKVKIETK